MNVAELSAYHVRIPLRKPIRHASHVRCDTDNVVVRCVLTDGTTGFGEGVPREYVTGASLEQSLDLLKQTDWRGQFEPCRDFAAAVELAGRLTISAPPEDDRGILGNAARCAVELAVLDAFGKHFHESIASVPLRVAPELYQPQPWVRYSGAITSARGLKLRLAAWGMRLYGFHQLKVKVGIAGYDDAARLRIIRSRCGRDMDIRVDANEAWSAEEAPAKIAALKPFDVSSIEQPIPHAQAAKLAEVRKASGVLFMLDESLCGMVDAERAVAGSWCDLFNLRLSKCGGLIPTLRLAQFAARAGVVCQLGCQVGETAILSAAGRHFACHVAGLRFLEGSYDRHLVREPLGQRDITFGWGGKAPALTAPGLGIDVDEAALERVTVKKEPLLG